MQGQLPRHLELLQVQDLSGLVLVQLIWICQDLEQEVRLERLQAPMTVAGSFSLMEATEEDRKLIHLTHPGLGLVLVLGLDLEGVRPGDQLINKLVLFIYYKCQ